MAYPAIAQPDPLRDASGAPLRIAATRDLDALERAWRAFEATAVGHVFQTFSFVSAWCRHVASPQGIEPVVVTGTFEDGRLAYLLPLGIRRLAGARAVEWLGGEQADYHGGLFDPGYLKALSASRQVFDAFVADFVTAAGGADLLHFVQMPAELDGAPSPFLHASVYPNANGAHSTRLEPDWDSYYAAKRKSGWRRTDRAKERRLAELGEVSFAVASDAHTTDEILEALFAQKREGLARIGVDDMFAPPGVRDFYRRLAHDGRAGSHLAALRCGEKIIAASFGFTFRDTYYYVLHSYDLDAFAEYSPGRQLMYRLMQWCFANGIRTFDFTIGDEGYKDAWCERPLALVDAAIPMSRLGSVASGALRLRENAKRRIKSDETLWSAAVAIRKALLSLRRG